MQIGSTGSGSATPTDSSVSVLRKQQDVTKQEGAEMVDLIDAANPTAPKPAPGEPGSLISVHA